MQIEGLCEVCCGWKKLGLQFSSGSVNPSMGPGDRRHWRVLDVRKPSSLGPYFARNQHSDCIGVHSPLRMVADYGSGLHPTKKTVKNVNSA